MFSKAKRHIASTLSSLRVNHHPRHLITTEGSTAFRADFLFSNTNADAPLFFQPFFRSQFKIQKKCTFSKIDMVTCLDDHLGWCGLKSCKGSRFFKLFETFQYLFAQKDFCTTPPPTSTGGAKFPRRSNCWKKVQEKKKWWRKKEVNRA